MPQPGTLNMQVSVVLPPKLFEGLADNYANTVNKKVSFAGLALYALEELYGDLQDPEQVALVKLPPVNLNYTVSVPRDRRRAAHGFYSMKVPDSHCHIWWELLKQHRHNGPAALYRALLHLYQSVYDYYVEEEPYSPWLSKYPNPTTFV